MIIGTFTKGRLQFEYEMNTVCYMVARNENLPMLKQFKMHLTLNNLKCKPVCFEEEVSEVPFFQELFRYRYFLVTQLFLHLPSGTKHMIFVP